MFPKSWKEIKVETVARAMRLDPEKHLAALDPSKTISITYPNEQLFDLAA